MIQLHLIISGQVQGVFFRMNAKKRADELGLVGWVKNCDNGSVEMVLQGEKDVLERFVEWCRKGTDLAKVEGVEEDWGEVEKKYTGFQIKI